MCVPVKGHKEIIQTCNYIYFHISVYFSYLCFRTVNTFVICYYVAFAIALLAYNYRYFSVVDITDINDLLLSNIKGKTVSRSGRQRREHLFN